MLVRHSSRLNRLDHTVLTQRLTGAVSYDRIAGYFRSSLFEVAGEALAQVAGPVRIICNSDLDPQDLITAAAAQAALRRSWCGGRPEDAPPEALPRYRALFEALTSKKMEVRVLPDSAFGLIHGKAGVVRRADGSAIAFMGSVNESLSAWKLNYELLWEDNDPETIAWVQAEFDALWNDPRAVDLAVCPFIAQDVQRILSRRVIEPADLKDIADPTAAAAAAAVETPVYRRDKGLWPHQKYFAQLALERHRLGGARLVLADQVGLGKTVQLAMAAMLMALDDPDGGPILVLAPKPLLQQWQDELMELLSLPSARWNGKAWVDENDLEYPSDGAKSLGKCPRRIGLVSQGLVVRGLAKLLGDEPDDANDEDEDDAADEAPTQLGRPAQGVSDFKNFTEAELTSLRRCLKLLREGGNNDPKLEALMGYLLGTVPGVTRGWLGLGCILFSQYYDTVRWIGDELAKRPEFAGMDIGLYAGSNRSGLWRNGRFQRFDRNDLKARVRAGELKLLLGTDAASEGLNLQRLGTLINIDLPWNPTRLEQRKGRIQRIGQVRNEIWIANLRYRDSVEDRVHQVLADRLEAIHGLFGQIPDTLEDVWVKVALNDEQAAHQLIDRTTATRNPFDAKYSKVEDADWETCSQVLNGLSMKEMLSRGW